MLNLETAEALTYFTTSFLTASFFHWTFAGIWIQFRAFKAGAGL